GGEWRRPSRQKVVLRPTRMVSMAEKHLAVMTYEVERPEEPAPVVISSQVLSRQGGADEYHPGTSPGPEEAGFDPRRAEGFAHRVLETQFTYGKRGRSEERRVGKE